jgi:L-threonylcarbamoyladenylate synthase
MIISIDDPQHIKTISTLLKEKKIGIIPCDTIYGIVGIAPDTDSAIRDAKNRTETNPFLMLTHSTEFISSYSDASLPNDLRKYWPGPLTILFPKKNSDKKIAFRMPDNQFLIEILQTINAPLFSTSVNISGKPFLSTIKEIIKEFKDKVDFILDAGDLKGGVPSTIIDSTTDPYTVIRQGELVLKDIPLQKK